MSKVMYCNMCGKKLTGWDIQDGYSINTTAGYGSKHDGNRLELDLCCECMDKLIEQCKISPLIDLDEYWNFHYENREQQNEG